MGPPKKVLSHMLSQLALLYALPFSVTILKRRKKVKACKVKGKRRVNILKACKYRELILYALPYALPFSVFYDFNTKVKGKRRVNTLK